MSGMQAGEGVGMSDNSNGGAGPPRPVVSRPKLSIAKLPADDAPHSPLCPERDLEPPKPERLGEDVIAMRNLVGLMMGLHNKMAELSAGSRLEINPTPINVQAYLMDCMSLTLRSQAFIINELLALRGESRCIKFTREG